MEKMIFSVISAGHQYHPSAQPAQLANNYNSDVSPVCGIRTPLHIQRRTIPVQTTLSPVSSASSMTANTKPRNILPYPPNPGITSTNNVGGVEAENFMESFLDVPRINNIISGPAVEQEMSRINQVLSDVTADWAKRVDALKRLRSVVLSGGDLYKEFYSSLRFIDVSLICSVKDLRSQVVRETCVTLAFLSQQLGHKFERTAEVILPFLISLIPNSAKIISSSGIVAIRFILQNTHSPKLVPIIVNHLQTSRSKDIRRYCCEFVKHILFIWPKESLEKHAALLQDAIKRGIVDADPEARSLSRQAYWHFTTVFPNHADVLISQLDPSNKKMILEDNRGQVPVHAQASQRHTPPRDTAAPGTAASRSSSRIRRNEDSEPEVNGSVVKTTIRSSSAIDTDAARRARAKSNIPNAPLKPPASSGLATPLRSRKSFVTSSKPPSRATSPAITPKNGFLSRSSANSRDNSPEKLSSNKKAATGRSPSVSAGKRNQNDNKGYQSDNDDTGSQYGSQVSLSGQRYVYSVAEIMGFLNSPNWSSRKEGLLGLQKYLRSGTLYPADVDNVRLLLTRMMSDPTTKVFSLFLDTLYDFINVHKLDLGSWLYTLLTRLFGKMSVDLLPSVQCKVERCLELIRGSFAAENQFQQLLKFINDSLQTPNTKVKMAFLTYLTNLIRCNMVASDFKNTSAVRIGVTKLVNWSLDAKTPELRRAAQNVLIALHELNAGEFTSMLALMDEFLRDTALKVISGPPKKELSDKPAIGNGRSRQNSVSRNDLTSAEKATVITSPQSSNDENINPEDYYACLRQTTQAIEKFSLCSNLDYSSGDEGRKHPGSEDSGFSRNSLNVPVAVDDSENSSQPDDSIPEGSVLHVVPMLTDQNTKVALEGLDRLDTVVDKAHQWSDSEKDAIAKGLEAALNHSDSSVALSALHIYQRVVSMDKYMFKGLLPVILDLQGDSNRQVSDAVDKFLLRVKDICPLSVVCEILGGHLMEAESCTGIKAASLLLRIIQTSENDVLLNAIPDLMPVIVQGFNLSMEPNIRKECMLCIIEIQLKFGADAVFPYIKDLSVNKIKLLNLYLQRK
ncbi:CLIP-associating protein 1-like isoform X2 [Paramacrobiotus metropolitanus]|uniref:CLIP-associating protein 1-like isoform X2 n=1 Tax=Paramacrobiotus metropolitanus TaxID=2943436 RepID=UPI00244639B1|nr:CLIP-associating protein 1-like isoform X2 [Paramacrobiotus metropolitanus]